MLGKCILNLKCFHFRPYYGNQAACNQTGRKVDSTGPKSINYVFN